jgi:hypothetical protein
MSSRWRTRSQNSLQHIQNLAQRWEVVWALPLQYTQALPSDNNSSTSKTYDYGAGRGAGKASSVYKIFDDTALDAAVQGLWDLEGVADQDWILDNAQSMKNNYLDFWDSSWQLAGGE